MATLDAAITGKRKREDGRARISQAKRPAYRPTPKQALAKTGENDRVIQIDAQTRPQLKSKSKSSSDSGVQPATQMATNGGRRPPLTMSTTAASNESIHVQIITGSYERVLHGAAATIPRSILEQMDKTGTLSATTGDGSVTFSDTFLFAAHASAIRCLSISPPTEANWRYLATGSSDERINVYSISTAPPKTSSSSKTPSLASNPTAENPRNRSLGTLIHHDRPVNCLQFPAKGKLFSAAEDNTIAISRTRDWTMLSSIKAPIPKAQGRPSGDTAAPGETPAGVNDFAIHPSQKLMLSVGRGERCLRLWNLMTGKKAGVLNFDRELLSQVGEGKHSSGEARYVLWDGTGKSYVIGFERGAAVFGIDSQPRAVIRPSSSTKFHRFRMIKFEEGLEALAISTEDGRLLFYEIVGSDGEAGKGELPLCRCLAQLGGRSVGITGRVKDFDVVELPGVSQFLIVTASSDGTVRLWTLPRRLIVEDDAIISQAGRLIGTLDTHYRITCLGALLLDGKVGNADHALSEDELAGFDEEDEAEESGD